MMNEDAFRAIYEQYWSKLYSVCFYTVASREVAEDLVMEIFLSIWNNREKLQIDNLEHYLVRAAKNKAIKHILQQRKSTASLHLMMDALEQLPADNTPQHHLELKELTNSIADSVSSLPEKTQQIFLLNREHGLTYQEIAQQLGVSVKTVEYHISKALRILSRLVVAYFITFFP
ncbi:RNA polymerase sigma-70 factor [Chitinophaga sp. MM2321]|uniref:RNA polymerase sigma-70 factor n=1 Tax=Chitinophaga sp. MM2321 TaxID=3137178 RepID=UPI0032D57063